MPVTGRIFLTVPERELELGVEPEPKKEPGPEVEPETEAEPESEAGYSFWEEQGPDTEDMSP